MKLGCYPHISVATIHEEVCASIRCTHLFILFYSVLLMHIMRLRLPFFVNNRGAVQSVGLWLRLFFDGAGRETGLPVLLQA